MIGWRFSDPSPMRELLEQMLESSRSPRHGGRGTPMPINVHDNGREVVVEAALPGVTPDKVDIDSADGLLTIRARAEFAERDYMHQELQTTDYVRQLQLPPDCRYEEARADFENGMLTITVPKAQPKQPEKIRIQVTRKERGPETIEAKPGEGYSEVKRPRKRS